MKLFAKSIVALGLFLAAFSSLACEGGSSCVVKDLDDPQPKVIESVDQR
jgi:hypothetical protein